MGSSTHDTCGIGIRGVAIAIDAIVWFLLLFVAILPVAYVTGDVQMSANAVDADLSGRPAAAAMGLWLALALGYHSLLEWRYGKTIGKYLVRIQVTRSDGSSISFFQAVTRNLLRLVDFLPGAYLVGILFMAISDRDRRLGDHLGRTLVVRK
jgi:uncharacterized RDD family membrane protein YckC